MNRIKSKLCRLNNKHSQIELRLLCMTSHAWPCQWQQAGNRHGHNMETSASYPNLGARLSGEHNCPQSRCSTPLPKKEGNHHNKPGRKTCRRLLPRRPQPTAGVTRTLLRQLDFEKAQSVAIQNIEAVPVDWKSDLINRVNIQQRLEIKEASEEHNDVL